MMKFLLFILCMGLEVKKNPIKIVKDIWMILNFSKSKHTDSPDISVSFNRAKTYARCLHLWTQGRKLTNEGMIYFILAFIIIIIIIIIGN